MDNKKRLASVSTSIDRARRKLEVRTAQLASQVNAETLEEAKARVKQQLHRRNPGREPVEKETLAQFADCKTLVKESEALRKARGSLEGDAKRH